MDVITYLFHPQEKGHYLRRREGEKEVEGETANRMGGWKQNGVWSFNTQQNVSGWVIYSLQVRALALFSLPVCSSPLAEAKDHILVCVPTTGFFPSMTYL